MISYEMASISFCLKQMAAAQYLFQWVIRQCFLQLFMSRMSMWIVSVSIPSDFSVKKWDINNRSRHHLMYP